MIASITMVVSVLALVLYGFPPATYGEMDARDAHRNMEKMMRDCESLSQNLKGMFDQLEKMETAVNSPQQTAEVQKRKLG